MENTTENYFIDKSLGRLHCVQIYREFSPNANFITANLVTAVFQNFLDIFCYCDFISILLMRFFG